MKKSIQNLMMVAALVCGTMSMTSCDEIMETIFGEWDKPATPETIVKATDLLKEAQKEGANVVFWYHYEGGLFYAVFKRWATCMSIRKVVTATRHPRGAVSLRLN